MILSEVVCALAIRNAPSIHELESAEAAAYT
jgi:hypothetical protein